MKHPAQSDVIVRSLAEALAAHDYPRVLALVDRLEPFVETAAEGLVLRNARALATDPSQREGGAAG